MTDEEALAAFKDPKRFPNLVSPVLQEMHEMFWENDAMHMPNEWSDADVAYATKIFMKIVFERMWRRGNTNSEVAEETGREMRDFVLEKTGLDLHDFYDS